MPKHDRYSDAVNQLSHQMHASVSELIQSSFMAVQKENHLNVAEATLIASHAIIAGLELMAMMVAKKPNISRQEAEDLGSQLTVNLVTPETILFSALLTAKMHQGTRPLDNMKSLTSIEFGPSIFLEAIEAFEKAMGFEPDKYLEPGLVSAARDVQRGSEAPLVAFMAKKQESKSNPLN